MAAKHLSEKRLDNFRSVLRSRGLDAILLANFWADSPQEGDYSLYYASNLLRRYSQCLLILTQDDCRVWVEDLVLDRAREESWLGRIEPMEPSEEWGYSGEEFARIAAKHLRAMVGKEKVRVGVNGRYLPSAVGLHLVRAGLSIDDVGVELEKSRRVKDERELKALRKACQIVDAGVVSVMDSIREGVTEHELAALAEGEMRKNGAECFWWKTLLASGPQAEEWTATPSDRRIRNGDLVVMDFSPVYQGYAGDIARSFVYGKARAEQLQVFDLAEKALQTGVSALKQGVTCGEVMHAAAQEVEGSPYEQFYMGAGHGIGLHNETYPIFLCPISQMRTLPAPILEAELRTNMAVAIEIIFTVPGLGGVRLEDDYIVTAGGSERLTHAPIQAEV